MFYSSEMSSLWSLRGRGRLNYILYMCSNIRHKVNNLAGKYKTSLRGRDMSGPEMCFAMHHWVCYSHVRRSLFREACVFNRYGNVSVNSDTEPTVHSLNYPTLMYKSQIYHVSQKNSSFQGGY